MDDCVGLGRLAFVGFGRKEEWNRFRLIFSRSRYVRVVYRHYEATALFLRILLILHMTMMLDEVMFMIRSHERVSLAQEFAVFSGSGAPQERMGQ